MGLGSKIGVALKPMIDLAYPPRCPICGDATGTQDGLCLRCWGGLEQPAAPQCSLCQRPLPASLHGEADAACAACLTVPPRHAGIAAATIYTDASRKLVLAFKHGGRISLARMMARLMAAKLGPLGGKTILVPVPLHRWRLWQRGYNQSALLAQELSRLTGAPVKLDGLQRYRATPSLGGLGKKARKKALRGAIRTHPKTTTWLRGAEVVLVDDVMTSGATADVCISALLKGGAANVRISCFARVIDGDRQSVIIPPSKPENETPGAPFGTPGAA